MSELNQLENQYSVDAKYMKNGRLLCGLSILYADEKRAFGRVYERWNVAPGFNENPVKNKKKQEKDN